MQLEVAERVTAKPKTKAYGIPSVVFQLYCTPKMNFKIPPSVFFPKPNVDSALVTFDFTKPHPELSRINGANLRTLLTKSFQQRRKVCVHVCVYMCVYVYIGWDTPISYPISPITILTSTPLYPPTHTPKYTHTHTHTYIQMLRASLKDLLLAEDMELPERWQTLRPEVSVCVYIYICVYLHV